MACYSTSSQAANSTHSCHPEPASVDFAAPLHRHRHRRHQGSCKRLVFHQQGLGLVVVLLLPLVNHGFLFRPYRHCSSSLALFFRQPLEPGRHFCCGQNAHENGNPMVPASYQPSVSTSSSSSLSMSLHAMDSVSSAETSRPVIWNVYVDQSKASLDRGGSATLDAFIGLAPPDLVHVQPALFPKSTKLKGPLVRCMPAVTTSTSVESVSSSSTTPMMMMPTGLEVTNVDSVDKVYRILQKHMKIQKINSKIADCLKYKYKGNSYLEAGKIDLAIEAYDQALEYATASSSPTQHGIVLLMRATAHLQRAHRHQIALQGIVQDFTQMVPDSRTLQTIVQEAAHAMHTVRAGDDSGGDTHHKNIDHHHRSHEHTGGKADSVIKTASSSSSSQSTNPKRPALANALFRRIVEDSEARERQFRKTQYRHGMYQYALLQAAQDALGSTQFLPRYSTCWLRAGEILSELWKLRESAYYYHRAIQMDNTLQDAIQPVLERLQKRQELLDKAREYGWSEDTLRLALDVAATTGTAQPAPLQSQSPPPSPPRQ